MQKNGSIGIYYQSQKRPKTAVENALKCDRGIFYRYSQAFCRDRSPLGQFPKKVGKGVKTGTGVYSTGSLGRGKWEGGINTQSSASVPKLWKTAPVP